MTATPNGVSPRELLARDVEQLLHDGYFQREVADVLGISRSYVSELHRDPTGARTRARKDSYRRPCPSCGKPMDGSNGRGPSRPKVCTSCARQRTHDERYWTRERIVEAIQRFAAENGRKPRSTEWLQGRHGRDGDGYPYIMVVQREFGSWNAAMQAAGFAAEPSGKYVRRPETLAKMRANARARYGGAGRGALDAKININVEHSALARLQNLPGTDSAAEHVRRAVDLYLDLHAGRITVRAARP